MKNIGLNKDSDRQKRILVTGSKGTIGSWLVPFLREKGHRVFGCDIIHGVEPYYIMADVTKPTDLEAVFDKECFDVVIHLAAICGREVNELFPSLAIENNIVGVINMAQICKRYGSRLVFTSTSEVYGDIGGILYEDREDINPNNRYGLVKLLCEKILQYEAKNCSLDVVILRPFMMYTPTEPIGEHRSALVRFCQGLLKKEKITVHKDSSRPWLWIEDAINIIAGLALLEEHDGIAPIYNIGTADTISTLYLAEHLCRHLGLDSKEYIELVEQPDKMTLNKNVITAKQVSATGYVARTSIFEGSIKVLKEVERRMKYEGKI